MNTVSVLDVHVDIDTIKTGDKLYSLRKGKGYSQNKVAKMVGVSTKTISNWEQGHKLFTLKHLAKLSYIYGVKTDDILCLTAEDVVLFRSVSNTTSSVIPPIRCPLHCIIYSFQNPYCIIMYFLCEFDVIVSKLITLCFR